MLLKRLSVNRVRAVNQVALHSQTCSKGGGLGLLAPDAPAVPSAEFSELWG